MTGKKVPNSKRLVFVGGFLGAGKTTAIIRFVRWLKSRHMRVAVITNDQAAGLVDTNVVRRVAALTREIAGGCFCCRSDLLVSTINDLLRNEQPNVIIAEPVGSCTDIRATVIKPLLKVYDQELDIAPFSVLIDPFAAKRVLSDGANSCFHHQIDYIASKQLEEADLVILNKTDLASKDTARELSFSLSKKYCRNVQMISARTGMGCGPWFKVLENSSTQNAKSLKIDYAQYADGEAMLAWLNCTGSLSRNDSRNFRPGQALKTFALAISDRMKQEGAVIAHFKAIIEKRGPNTGNSSLKATNYYVAQIGGPKAPLTFEGKGMRNISAASLAVNIRGQTKPHVLKKVIRQAIADVSPEAIIKLQGMNAFAPSPPKPLQRLP